MALGASINSIGDQQLTVSSSALRLTMPTNAAGKTLNPRHACIYVGGDAIRWLGGNAAADGVSANTTPTATRGLLVAAGTYIQWLDPAGDYLNLIKNAQFIRVTTDATLDIIFFS